jgi:hypothetical protein
MRIFRPIHHLDLNINHFLRTLHCSKVSIVLVCIVSSLNSRTEFFDEIEIMRSLAKPRKITIMGSDGQIYMFLGKPKDDLRKDARLMDFNAMINKLLKANSESRRRQLREQAYEAWGDDTTKTLPSRYPNLWCRHSERRMRLHSMGAEHDPHPTCLDSFLRCSTNSRLGR